MTNNDLQTDGDFVCELIQSGVSLAEGFPRLIEFCQSRYPKRDWQKIATLDLDADIATLVNWLTHLLTSEPPHDNIMAFYFGLYNPSDGENVTCGFYVCGSTQFSVESMAWAAWRKDSYIPEGRYAPLNNLNRIYTIWDSTPFDNESNDFSQHSDKSEYALFLGYAGLMVGEVGRRVSPARWLGTASERILAAGWDEGDIFEVGKITPSGFEKWQPPVYTLEELLEKLRSPESSSRRYGVNQLAELGDRRAIEPLVNVLLNDPDEMMPFTVIRALQELGDKQAVPALVQTLQQNTQWVIRLNAMQAIVVLDPAQAIATLIQLLRNDRQLRWDAHKALHKIGTPEALAAIDQWERERQGQEGLVND